MPAFRRLLCITALFCTQAIAAPLDGDMDSTQTLFTAPDHALAAGHAVKLQEMSETVVDRTSEVIATAMGFVGVPYRRGGANADTGLDCSGLVKVLYEKVQGLSLPHRAKDQAAVTEKIDKQDLQPGDLVFFNTMRRAFSHVGVYLGDGKFIHAPRTGAKVRVEDMDKAYWKRRFNGARRVAAGDMVTTTARLPDLR
ncbi:hypothetical protein GCM10022279_14290 [Comamonas faecalis]|uniref:NlpC/P60 domain-containing protein n=1 Tax=Comamonas faecalis TaxID=1387849 RepID=A0ABP7R557_9BURK